MQKKARKSKRAKFWKSLFIFLILLAVWSIIADIIVIFWGESYPRETGFFINAVKYSIFFLFAKSLIKLNAYSFKKIMGSFSIKKVPWTKLLTINLFIIFLNLPFMATLLESQSLFSLKILNGFLPAPKETLYHLPSSLLMVIFAPFVEEVLFRGFLLNKIGEKQTTASSLLLSSIIFSVFHLNGIALSQFFAGLFFGICYIQTKKLIVPILLHMISNALPLLLARFTRLEFLQTPPFTTLEASLTQETIILPILVLVCSYVFYKSIKKLPKTVPLARVINKIV